MKKIVFFYFLISKFFHFYWSFNERTSEFFVLMMAGKTWKVSLENFLDPKNEKANTHTHTRAHTLSISHTDTYTLWERDWVKEEVCVCVCV